VIDTDAVVAHFTTQLEGGAAIAARRLHLALCRAGVKSVLHFGAGEAVDFTMIPAFRIARFFGEMPLRWPTVGAVVVRPKVDLSPVRVGFVKHPFRVLVICQR